MLKYINIAFLSILSLSVKAQSEPFNYEFYGGLTLHTSGWGVNMAHSKYLTTSKRQIIEFDFVSFRHPKQQRIRATQREKRFVYGKLNSIYVFRAGYGRKSVLGYDFNNKGVEVSFSYTGGLSVAAVKPVYLNIYNAFSPQTPTLERYNPEEHNIFDIYSGGPNFSGLNEITPVFGAYARAGLMFDYSPYKNFVRAIEIGASIDYFIKPLPMMAYNENYSLFPNLYFKLMFGRVYR